MDEEQPTAEGKLAPPVRELDLDSLKALSHPLRVQIVNALSVYGSSTASALAERFGESSGATSYHLRQLERHGFVREVEGKGTGRERWWERVPEGLNIGSPDAEATPAGRSAARVILRQFRQSNEQLLSDFIERAPEVLPSEWRETSEIRSATARLTLEQMRAFVGAMNGVIDTHFAPFRTQEGPGTRAVQAHFNAFPVLDAAIESTTTDPGEQQGDAS